MKPHTVVLDNGTGFTKLGYGGNKEPNFVIPTCVAIGDDRVASINAGRCRIEQKLFS